MNAPQPPEPAESSALSGFALVQPRTDRTHRWGFGAFFLAEGVFVLASVILAAGFGDLRVKDHHVGIALLVTLILPSVLSGAVAVLASVMRGAGPREDFGLRWNRSDVTTGLQIGLVGLMATTAASVAWTHWIGVDQASSSVSELLDGIQLPIPLAILIFLHVWLVAPLCEELVYRGLLWGAMERLRWSQATTFLLTTAAFAIGHLEPRRTLLLLVIAVPIGLARMLTGRLVASIVAHQMNNFLPALGLLLMSLGVMPS